jgi:hypothetical protein
MRPQGPKFWLLKGDLDWRTGYETQVATNGDIRLAIDPNGPLALTGRDESLGGLVLPPGMALDATYLLYLLDLPNHQIKRFDPGEQGFLPLPDVGESGSDPRQFLDPTAITIAGGDLYVADRGNRRVQVFALSTLALRYLWGSWDEERGPVEAGDDYAWEPVDVAAAAGRAFILDRRYGRVLVHRPGSDDIEVLIEGCHNAGRFSRIALDGGLRIYLLDPAKPSLEVYSPEGKYLESRRDPGELLDRFAVPPIRLDHKGRFCLPKTLARDCPRELPSSPASPQTPLAACGSDQGGLLFDRDGNAPKLPADPEVAGPPSMYARAPGSAPPWTARSTPVSGSVSS